MTQVTGKKHRLAVVGGGMSAMTAVFEMTSQKGWDEVYDITVYQTGWRLGGKGASGRNRAHHDRIEEHGLHIFMGFYENAFRVLRAVYEELDRPHGAPLRTWEEAFKGHDDIVLFENDGCDWKPWPFPFPPTAGTPGDGELLPPMWSYVPMILEAMLRTLASFETDVSAVARVLDKVVDAAREEIVSILAEVMPDSTRGSVLRRALRAPVPAPARRLTDRAPVRFFVSVLKAMRRSAEQMGMEDVSTLRRWAFDALLPLLDQLTRAVWDEIGTRADVDDQARRTWILVDLMTTNVKGMIRDDIVFPPFDFEAIDNLDYKEWLRQHGAHPKTVDSAPVNAIYDLVFARHAGICAGSALRGSLRMLLAYKGHIFYKMQAGMGDVIFGPVYEVLKRRGVKFEFFHRLDDVKLSRDRKRAAELHFGVQATIKGDDKEGARSGSRRRAPERVEYQPLYDVKGLPCWPSEPLWEQLVEGDALREARVDLENFFDRSRDVGKVVLRDGVDFDAVILGASIGALPHIAKDVVANSAKLRAACENVRTTATQAVQLWLKPDLAGLGWKGPSPVTGTYAKPFDTWADMSHLIERETFPGDGVGNVAYFCGHLPDPEVPPGMVDPHPFGQRDTRDNAIDWLSKYPGLLWPNATMPGHPDALDYDLLVCADDKKGVNRLDQQYIRCSVNPSDRYVMSVPGSTQFRPRTEETSLENLFVTGDWTRTGIQGGCAEGAVMAGLHTSRAICGVPLHIVGDDDRGPDEPLIARLPPPRYQPPRYVERGGDIVLRPPYAQNGTRMYVFLLPADKERLQGICDRHLNIGKTMFKPVGPFVVLGVADISQIRSLHPEDSKKGFLAERDVAFWMPVVAGTEVMDVFVPSQAMWYLPYIWVDSAAPMAVGREVYGFPKLSGRIDIQEPEGTSQLVTVDALAIDHFSPATRAREQRILEVRRKADDDRGVLEKLWDVLDGAVSGLSEGFLDAAQSLVGDAADDAVAQLLRDLSPQNAVRMAFLKQFRGVGDADGACYQRVVEAHMRVTGYRAGGLLPGPFDVHIARLDSHPIVRDLGLPGARIEPVFSAWMDFDFDVDEGREMP